MHPLLQMASPHPGHSAFGSLSLWLHWRFLEQERVLGLLPLLYGTAHSPHPHTPRVCLCGDKA